MLGFYGNSLDAEHNFKNIAQYIPTELGTNSVGIASCNARHTFRLYRFTRPYSLPISMSMLAPRYIEPIIARLMQTTYGWLSRCSVYRLL